MEEQDGLEWDRSADQPIGQVRPRRPSSRTVSVCSSADRAVGYPSKLRSRPPWCEYQPPHNQELPADGGPPDRQLARLPHYVLGRQGLHHGRLLRVLPEQDLRRLSLL